MTIIKLPTEYFLISIFAVWRKITDGRLPYYIHIYYLNEPHKNVYMFWELKNAFPRVRFQGYIFRRSQSKFSAYRLQNFGRKTLEYMKGPKDVALVCKFENKFFLHSEVEKIDFFTFRVFGWIRISQVEISVLIKILILSQTKNQRFLTI